MITTLYLPDGSVISSGTPGEAAICSFSLTKTVCSGQELTPGGCCAAMVQLEVLGSVSLREGDEITVCRGDRTLGIFLVTKLEQVNQRTNITAYDRIILLDREVAVTGGTLLEIARDVCDSCGLTLKNESLPQGDFTVATLSGKATGRQVLQWIGEATGCFCVADSAGNVELRWFTPTDTRLQWCYLSRFEGYGVEPVEKVQIAATSTDMGVVWPNVTGQVNTYIVRSNPLLSAPTEHIARHLFQRMQDVTYTPCSVTVPESTALGAGDIAEIQGHRVYIMSERLQNGRKVLQATGSRYRSSSTAVNSTSMKALSGRVLELDSRVEGLRVENRETSGQLSRLTVAVEGMTASVQGQLAGDRQRLTRLEQTAQQLQLQVESAAGQVVTSTGYTFDDTGLHIAQRGSEIENRLDHSGMVVRRYGVPILQADSTGVTATDVVVRNFLHVGTHSRFEDYGGRTACFFMEGE